MIRRAVLLALLLAGGTGCVLSIHTPPASPPATVPPGETRVYAGEPPPGSYDVVGAVAVDVPGDGFAALAQMRTDARALGADAVIRARLTKFGTAAQRTGMAGIAVRMRARASLERY